MVSASRVRELLEERPDLEPAVVAILDTEPPWTFDDVEVDSGVFGELVSEGLVEKTPQGRYRVSDREAIRTAVELDGPADTTESAENSVFAAMPGVDQAVSLWLVGMLAIVVGFRVIAWPLVFKSGHVVLSANDPYYYQYWVEVLLSTPRIEASTLPSGVTKGEPLLVIALWLAAHILGGSTQLARLVLAWYPVIAAVFTAVLVYSGTVLVTEDRRIGLAATGMFAVLPAHVFRTSLGFADHHPFDYLWLAVTLHGLILLVQMTTRESSPIHLGSIAGILAVTIGVTAQSLAWDNSPIIIAVLGPYFLLESLRAAAQRHPPLRTTGPSLLGVALASGLVWLAHDTLGWHSDLVASAPLLLFIGGLAVVVSAELAYRVKLSAIVLAAGQVIISGIVILAVRRLRPDYWSRLVTSVESRLLAERAIAEVHSIFDQSFGWLLLFGFILMLALPYLAWASTQAMENARYMPPVVYSWYFLGLAAIQARFVGELAPSLSLFAGLGIVHLGERIDLIQRPAPFAAHESPPVGMPSAQTFSYAILLFLLISGLGILQVGVKTNQIATPHGQSETAFYLANYSSERSLESPENYVFSPWGTNRAYNYFVSGDSQSYGYAQSNYDEFLISSDPASWYDQLSPRRFVVVTPRASQTSSDQLGSQLYTQNGNPPTPAPGLAHYRLIYVSPDEKYKAFELVPGAIIKGQHQPNATITAETSVTVPGGSFSYPSETAADSAGNFSLRVPYPGTYQVGDQQVKVSEDAVYNGSTIPIRM